MSGPKFPRVKEAREALQERALSILGLYMTIINKAVQDGNLDVAAEHTRWLLEHMPAEAGVRLIDPSAAKVKEVSIGPAGPPPIQIGIALGGITSKPALPPAIIDVEPEDQP
jgi:hypothetical protein